ncbi:hypothetical protein [Salinimicrobium xinjiangense]|uniref:hypothetical protein n=1 Tax=Salinimicrobium xinjiangense TaxID=438596 RepID=UPI00042043CE|nr:hypothetical protein [Salinimicrobium xinjiangense]
MKFKDVNLILGRLRKGQNFSPEDDPEIIKILEDLKLIEVYKNKILLTDNGILAADMGIKEFLKYSKIEKEILNFSLEKNRKNGRILLLISVLFFLLFLAALFTNFSFLNDF